MGLFCFPFPDIKFFSFPFRNARNMPMEKRMRIGFRSSLFLVSAAALAAMGNPEVDFMRTPGAAESGGGAARLEPAEMLFAALGTERDPTAAVVLWREAAEGGSREAMKRLGDAHRAGIGVEASAVTAAHWYRRSAELGHVGAQVELADLLQSDDAGRADFVEALAWLSLAVEEGAHPRALKRLENVMTGHQRKLAEAREEELRGLMREHALGKLGRKG